MYLKLSQPRGVTFKTQREHRLPKFHTFINVREDRTNVYGAVLTFYEHVDDDGIRTAMKTLQDMHKAEQASSSQGSTTSCPTVPHQLTQRNEREFDYNQDHLYVTKSLCLVSVAPFVNACEAYLSWVYEIITGQCTIDLPLESFIYNIIYEVPLPAPGKSVRLNCLQQPITCQRPGWCFELKV